MSEKRIIDNLTEENKLIDNEINELKNKLKKLEEDKESIDNIIEQQKERSKLEEYKKIATQQHPSTTRRFQLSDVERNMSKKEIKIIAYKKEAKNNQDLVNYYNMQRDISIYNSFVNDIPPLTHQIFQSFLSIINEYSDFEYLKKELYKWINNKEKNEITTYEKNILKYYEDVKLFKEGVESIYHNMQKDTDEIIYIEDIYENELGEWAQKDKEKYLILNYWYNNQDIFEKEYDLALKHKNFFDLWRTEVIDKLTIDWIENPQNLGHYQNQRMMTEIKDVADQTFNYVANSSQYDDLKILCEPKIRGIQLDDITKGLERQLHLSIDEQTKICYISDGSGKFQILNNENQNNIFKIIKERCFLFDEKSYNTQELKPIKNFTRTDLFVRVPEYITQKIIPEKNLVAFRNGFVFFDKKNNFNSLKLEKFDQKYPRLPLKTINADLILDYKIEGTDMEKIFNNCFTKEDKQLLLIYIGMCMYEPGYTKHQFAIYMLGKGGIGKTTLLENVICLSLFNGGKIDAKNLNTDHRFALASLQNCDLCMIDEITTADSSSQAILKDIINGGARNIEAKGKDIITLPPEYVPQLIIAGNGFRPDTYDELKDISNWRRILPITPIRSFRGFCNVEDLMNEKNLTWLTQAATKAYWDSNLSTDDGDIFTIHPELITQKVVEQRIKLNTFPEKYILQQHFIMHMDGNQADATKKDETDKSSDYIYSIYSKDLFKFIHYETKYQMLATTINENMKGWKTTVEDAFDTRSVLNFTYRKNNRECFIGLEPITEKAKDFLSKCEDPNFDIDKWGEEWDKKHPKKDFVYTRIGE